MVRYTRTGGRKPPRDREQFEIRADGSFTMWRSIGSASYPPSPIGRFAGQLDSTLQAELEREVTAAASTGNLKITPPPGAAIEKIEVGDVNATLGIHDEPDGAWGALVERLRELLNDLTNYPQSAIALEVQPGGHRAHLVHRGEETLRLDLSHLTIRAVLWQSYRKEADWRSSEGYTESPPDFTANPGWSLELPFNHGFEVAEGHAVVAYVTLTAFDGKRPVPVSLESRRSDDR